MGRPSLRATLQSQLIRLSHFSTPVDLTLRASRLNSTSAAESAPYSEFTNTRSRLLLALSGYREERCLGPLLT